MFVQGSASYERTLSNWVIINIPWYWLLFNSAKTFLFFFDLGALLTWPTWQLTMLLFNGV